MRKILLTQGMFAVVDDDDYEWLIQWKWQYNGGYASRRESRNGKIVAVLMHREIGKIPDEMETDHINRNKLDNRKSNLRACTRSENMLNTKLQSTNTSGYRGVTRHGSKWQARIKLNGKMKHLGTYRTREEAAKRYDEEAAVLHGSFARLNLGEQ